MPAIDLQSTDQLEQLGKNDTLLALNFWAEWCPPCKHTNPIFDQLAETYGNDHFRFIRVDAEKLEDATDKFGVTAVPAFLFVKGGNVVESIEGANGPELATKVARFSSQLASKQVGNITGASSSTTTSGSSSKDDLRKRIEKLVNFAPVMIFIKGTPSQPQCGFSAKLIGILEKEGAKFESFNILSDDEVRQGLKEYSNWPTYPQLYVNGKLIGGLDIVKEMQEEGELASILAPQNNNNNSTASSTSSGESVPTTTEQPKEDLNTRLTKLVNTAPVMLFMKGSPDAPQCGFSSKIVEILKKNNVQFSSFNILADEEIRQGLKTFSNWPTYPQLYSKGKLVGGLDIVKELAEDGELVDALQ